MSSTQKFFDTEIRSSLQGRPKNVLFVSYLLIPKKHNFKQVAKWSKKQLIQKLFTEFPKKLLNKHKHYLDTLPVKKLASFQYYQTMAYMIINNYMRTGKYKLANLWEFNDQISQLLSVSPNALKNNKALKKYQNIKATEWNKFYKKFMDEQKITIIKVQDAIKDLKDVIRQAPKVNQTFYVYRGEANYRPRFVHEDDATDDDKKLINYNLNQLNLQKGHTYRAEGFNSFSLEPSVATQFSGMTVCCIYRLKITPKSKTPYLMFPLTQAFKEFEVLLPPVEFKITHISFIESPASNKIKIQVFDIEYVKSI